MERWICGHAGMGMKAEIVSQEQPENQYVRAWISGFTSESGPCCPCCYRFLNNMYPDFDMFYRETFEHAVMTAETEGWPVLNEADALGGYVSPKPMADSLQELRALEVFSRRFILQVAEISRLQWHRRLLKWENWGPEVAKLNKNYPGPWMVGLADDWIHLLSDIRNKLYNEKSPLWWVGRMDSRMMAKGQSEPTTFWRGSRNWDFSEELQQRLDYSANEFTKRPWLKLSSRGMPSYDPDDMLIGILCGADGECVSTHRKIAVYNIYRGDPITVTSAWFYWLLKNEKRPLLGSERATGMLHREFDPPRGFTTLENIAGRDWLDVVKPRRAVVSHIQMLGLEVSHPLGGPIRKEIDQRVEQFYKNPAAPMWGYELSGEMLNAHLENIARRWKQIGGTL